MGIHNLRGGGLQPGARAKTDGRPGGCRLIGGEVPPRTAKADKMSGTYRHLRPSESLYDRSVRLRFATVRFRIQLKRSFFPHPARPGMPITAHTNKAPKKMARATSSQILAVPPESES
jgi:hypothetical protein